MYPAGLDNNSRVVAVPVFACVGAGVAAAIRIFQERRLVVNIKQAGRAPVNCLNK